MEREPNRHLSSGVREGVLVAGGEPGRGSRPQQSVARPLRPGEGPPLAFSRVDFGICPLCVCGA